MTFEIFPIDERRAQGMAVNNVWSEECPIHYSRLVLVKVDHFSFDENEHLGELVVLEDVAEDVLAIFKELHSDKFLIGKMRPVEEYKGDDVASMEDNNSSAFNGRRIMNTDRWSSHAYGAAIDINPAQNPYMRLNDEDASIQVYPSSGLHNVNRNVLKPGMVEPVVELFADHGFSDWGGTWEHKPDYHHFQLPWDKIKKLV